MFIKEWTAGYLGSLSTLKLLARGGLDWAGMPIGFRFYPMLLFSDRAPKRDPLLNCVVVAVYCPPNKF
jgi:hypothetical protein